MHACRVHQLQLLSNNKGKAGVQLGCEVGAARLLNRIIADPIRQLDNNNRH